MVLQIDWRNTSSGCVAAGLNLHSNLYINHKTSGYLILLDSCFFYWCSSRISIAKIYLLRFFPEAGQTTFTTRLIGVRLRRRIK